MSTTTEIPLLRPAAPPMQKETTDGNYFVSGGVEAANNGTVRLWDANTGQLLRATTIGDAESRRLLKSFHRGVDRSAVIRAKRFRTPVKTRILAGGVHAARQQVVRIDRDSGWPVAIEFSAAVLRKVSQIVNDCDAVILSDYGSDLVTPALADASTLVSAASPCAQGRSTDR